MQPDGFVFDIQKYSIHDGDGIRTNIFLLGCPLRCQWCSNPESQSARPQLLYTPKLCIGCSFCASACPEKLDPTLLEDRRTKCVGCGACAKVCPTGALRLAGRRMTVSEVLKEVSKDQVFYEHSGGGVTLTGGEPLVQWEFAEALLKALKELGYKTAIETTGFAPWEHVRRVAYYTDTVLYDIKLIDSQRHKKYTGVGNALIHENAARLREAGARMIIRVPLMGGINDDEENIRKTGAFALDIGVREIHLLPYHRMGEPKYEKLGKAYSCKAYTPSAGAVDGLKAMLEDMGISVQVGG